MLQATNIISPTDNQEIKENNRINTKIIFYNIISMDETGIKVFVHYKGLGTNP